MIGRSVNVCYVESCPIGFLLCQWSRSATVQSFQLQHLISQSGAKKMSLAQFSVFLRTGHWRRKHTVSWAQIHQRPNPFAWLKKKKILTSPDNTWLKNCPGRPPKSFYRELCKSREIHFTATQWQKLRSSICVLHQLYWTRSYNNNAGTLTQLFCLRW